MQAARRIVELLFGRLDARIASFESTANLIGRTFPGDYRVILPGADAPAATPDDGLVRIAFADEEDRSALRLFLRALRRLDVAAPWQATVLTDRGAAASALRLPARLRARGRSESAGSLAGADVVVAASAGPSPAPGLVRRAVAAGAVPLASSLAVY